jgi:hypothetical protein
LDEPGLPGGAFLGDPPRQLRVEGPSARTSEDGRVGGPSVRPLGFAAVDIGSCGEVHDRVGGGIADEPTDGLLVHERSRNEPVHAETDRSGMGTTRGDTYEPTRSSFDKVAADERGGAEDE